MSYSKLHRDILIQYDKTAKIYYFLVLTLIIIINIYIKSESFLSQTASKLQNFTK